jgi:hypothetical protein
MVAQLALATLLIVITALIHVMGLVLLSSLMPWAVRRCGLHRDGLGKTTAMLLIVVSLLVMHAAEIWAWAAAYLAVGALPNLETALYFSSTTYSTLGYGDVVLPAEWRLFGSLEGINGLLLIGWSTAYLVSASLRIGPLGEDGKS